MIGHTHSRSIPIVRLWGPEDQDFSILDFLALV